MTNPRFQIFQGANMQYYFRLRIANHEIILISPGYSHRQSCREGIESVKLNAAIDSLYERRDAPMYTFTLKSASGETIGHGESYSTRATREASIAAVKSAAPDAPIEE